MACDLIAFLPLPKLGRLEPLNCLIWLEKHSMNVDLSFVPHTHCMSVTPQILNSTVYLFHTQVLYSATFAIASSLFFSSTFSSLNSTQSLYPHSKLCVLRTGVCTDKTLDVPKGKAAHHSDAASISCHVSSASAKSGLVLVKYATAIDASVDSPQ